jgi:hypothetical protein
LKAAARRGRRKEAPHSKFAHPCIVLYQPVARSAELSAQFDAAVSARPELFRLVLPNWVAKW